MSERLRFAEDVCAGHPDRLADEISDRIVRLAVARDDRALVGVEVALHRQVVFIDGRIAAGPGPGEDDCAVSEPEIADLVRAVYRDAGYGTTSSGRFAPDPGELEIRFDLCLGPLLEAERDIRDIADDQAICVGYACAGERAGFRPLEQALATDFAEALARLRTDRPELGLGPDGKVLVAVRGTRLEGVSLSVHHRPGAEWIALTRAAREACEALAAEYVALGELAPLDEQAEWLVNGAGAFEIGGPLGDNGLSGKKLVAQAYGSAVPIGGGASYGKDPRKIDPKGQTKAREIALELVRSGRVREATVWLAFRPGEEEARWREVAVS